LFLLPQAEPAFQFFNIRADTWALLDVELLGFVFDLRCDVFIDFSDILLALPANLN